MKLSRYQVAVVGGAACIAIATVMALMGGCTPQPALTTEAKPTAVETNAASGNLTLALDSLRKLAEGNDTQPAQRTIFYLNQWISSDVKASSDWQPDRMLQNLPRALRNTPGLERLAELQFSLDDADYQRQAQWLDDISYLQQTLWLHDIAKRASREPVSPRLAAWLKEIETKVGVSEAEQLGKAERMLDWTVRNIQLDALPPIPKDPLATAGSTETILPAARGEIGPGYQQLPLQVLLHGHGDAQERARVFLLLCRQLGIEGVMLGFTEQQSASRRGWLPAVLVGGKLYLFDAALGFPLPGAEGQGIATLNDMKENPDLLKRLDVENVAKYPISKADIDQGVLAMIDAEPAALSRRMHLLQAAMPASTRLVLTTEPSKLDAALRKANVSGVSLWSVPFEAILFRLGRMQAAARDPQIALNLQKQNVLFAPARPLVKGRNLHLQGRFENEDQKPGARSLYLQCRPPNREIDALEHNEFYRKAVGLEQSLPEEPERRKGIIDFYTAIAREGKFDATYWLGLTYYESGNPKAAIEWLTRTVQDSPPSTWIAGGRYNLARCYEQLGDPALARQWLESDKDSPQRHGNLLRGQMLKAEAQ